jgi:CheY-like chemotaxis protein
VAKILVADDNSNIQKMVGLALKDQGIDVVAVGNGEAAVRKLADVKPDLVLADVFMPVRNGYEVCKYVKDDPAFAHVPVILLVGAFDPLDEQEAQRVGADGVLKKPFVPPDPLISMVKSALARAGVHIGPAAEEKPKETARNAADMLRANTAAKLAAVSEPKLPEAEAEPIEEAEEFPMAPAPVRVDANQGPVAFGSLLGATETEEAEDDTAFVPTGKSVPLERSWGADSDEPEEEIGEEEESEHGTWRPSGLEEPAAIPDSANNVSDWREEAFHGNSPAQSTRSSSSHWTPSAEKREIEAFAEAPSVAVSTLEHKPADAHEPVSMPFSGDAWAAAMAAGEEEKLATAEAALPGTNHPQAALEASADKVVAHENFQAEVSAPALQHQPKPAVVAYNAAPAAISVPEPQPEVVAHPNPEVAQVEAKPAESKSDWFSVPPSPWDLEARKVSQLAATWDSPAPAREKSPDETQDIPPYHVLSALKTQERLAVPVADEPVRAPAESSFEHATVTSEPTHEQVIAQAEAIHETVFPAEAVQEVVRAEMESASATPSEASESLKAPEPNMDEVVARVLEKLNPDMLHKVTQGILKPIIEALVKDELKK